MRFFTTILFLLGAYVAYSQVYQPEKHYLSLAAGIGGDEANGLWISDEITGANTATQTSYEPRNPPTTFAVNYQYGLHEYVSVGGYVSTSLSTVDLSGYTTRLLLVRGDYDGDGREDDVFTEQVTERRQLASTYFGIKGEFHFADFIGLAESFDFYTGLSIGGNVQRERVYRRESVAVMQLDYQTPNEVRTRDIRSNPSYTWTPDPNDVDGNLFVGIRYFPRDSWGLYTEAGLYHVYLQAGLVLKFEGALPFGL